MKESVIITIVSALLFSFSAAWSPLYADSGVQTGFTAENKTEGPAGKEEKPGAKTFTFSWSTIEELAKKVENPLSSLTSLPFQSAFDYNLGPRKEGFRYQLEIEPQIPVPLNKDWRIVARPQVNYISQWNVIGNSAQEGMGDTSLEVFFSPVKEDPVIWGVGPYLLFPTASWSATGTGKWAIGPAVAVIKQAGPWTIGVIATQTLSYAGDRDRKDLNATYVQPFVSHSERGLTLGSERLDDPADCLRQPGSARIAEIHPLQASRRVLSRSTGRRPRMGLPHYRDAPFPRAVEDVAVPGPRERIYEETFCFLSKSKEMMILT